MYHIYIEIYMFIFFLLLFNLLIYNEYIKEINLSLIFNYFVF